jgi:hypothetical protein
MWWATSAREVHLDGVLDGHQGLRPERVGATVPEEEGLAAGVHDGRRVARAELAAHSGRDGPRVAEGLRRIMAARAGDPAVGAHTAIEEQALAQERRLVGVSDVVAR